VHEPSSRSGDHPGRQEGSVNGDLLDLGRPAWRVYEQRETMAVLGAAGNPEADLFLEALEADGIPYRFRRGGGGTVILSPGQVVLALAADVLSPFENREYARRINSWIIDALASLGVTGVEQKGITDLAIHDRKILGTSIYRRRLILFYQASLLVDNDISLFDRYLRMPVKVPDYRGGRSHAEFCTTLVREGHELSTVRVIQAVEDAVRREIGGLG
jgi:lipoate-protein ligase A